MRRTIVRSILALLFVLSPLADAQNVWFSGSFAPGERWHAITEVWEVGPNIARLNTRSYDQVLAAPIYWSGRQAFSIEASLRGPRAGLVFGLDDTTSKVLAHMVRFDENNLLTGYFDAAGEFTATNTFVVAAVPRDWTALRVDVDPARGRYEVFVNGKSAGVDETLLFPGGYAGLQGSEGVSEFRSLTISGPSRGPLPPQARRGDAVSFHHVRFVKAGQGNVTIYNPETGTYQALDMNGKLLNQMPGAPPPKSGPTARRFGKEISATREGVVIADVGTGSTQFLPVRFGSPSALLIDTDTTVFVADAARRTIVSVRGDGSPARTFAGTSIGGLRSPRGMDFFGKDQIVVADDNRILFIDKSLIETPRVAVLSPTQISADWSPAGTTKAFIEYKPDQGAWTRVGATTDPLTGRATVNLPGLLPATRYSLVFSDACRAIPALGARSLEYRFVTGSFTPSVMLYTRLPVLCLVYRSITYRDRYPAAAYPQIPDGMTLNEGDINSLKDACRFNSEFYFRNSGCHLFLDFDVAVMDDPLTLGDLGGSDPYWLSPNERVTRDVEKAAHALGKTPEQYAGVVVPYAWVNFPPRRTGVPAAPSTRDTISIRQAYGGGTLGVPAPWKYGRRVGYTSNPFPDRFSRQDWLITHEFHHQLDALLQASGYADYDHADQPWKMPGRFGEDFDFNAHIIRNAAVGTWLTMRYGEIGQTRDADGDGVPDENPTLPFDEMRLGGNPGSRDSDGDGLDDLGEVMAGNSLGSRLDKQDTDGDGIIDGRDPEPLYPFEPVIPYRAAGTLPTALPFTTLQGADVSAQMFWWWTDSALVVAYNATKPANLLLQIDGSCDGWFHGFDNIQIRVVRDSASVHVAEYYLRDCSSWTDPPKDRKDILNPDALPVSAGRTGDSSATRYQLTISIPPLDRYGFRLAPGTQIGIRIGLQTTSDRWVWNELFERNYMMKVELK